MKVISYTPVKDQAQLTFLTERHDVDSLPLDKAGLQKRKDIAVKKMEAVLSYTTQIVQCRMQKIQSYFGEETHAQCGICDVCVKKKNAKSSYKIRREISLVLQGPGDIDKLRLNLDVNDEQLLSCLRHMLDDGTLIKKDKTFFLNNK